LAFTSWIFEKFLLMNLCVWPSQRTSLLDKSFSFDRCTLTENGSSCVILFFPTEQHVWRAARGTGAAPTFFRSMGRFLDGGLMANNPTLDIMTEIHKYYKLQHDDKKKNSSNIGLVVSLGTGTPPTEPVLSVDVFKPDSIWDATNIITGARALGMLLVDQVTKHQFYIAISNNVVIGQYAIPRLIGTVGVFF